MAIPTRPRSTLLSILLLWLAFYASFTLFTPPLLDDADSVHAEVAREMLLRHDYVTLYANGIRYLEKAPLFYWSMAFCMRISQLAGHSGPRALAVAARIPTALAILALALLLEAFARRLFHSMRAGLYAALILLSSSGIFLFTRILIPDAMVCLWLTLALYCFYRTEDSAHPTHLRLYAGGFATACALNVLTKGLIGVIFPVAIVLIYLLLTRGLKPTLHRLRELHPLASLEAFLLIAAPWHILAALANPTVGHPAPMRFLQGHWQVPLPTDGNVHGWLWFYFLNEHLFRYLNLRIPHDYDTAPLYLFWGLCLIWLMPWSAHAFKAIAWAAPLRDNLYLSHLRMHTLSLRRRGALLLLIAAAFTLLFFSLSTRQEYYVLPALPAIAILTAGWLASPNHPRANLRATLALLIPGTLYAVLALYALLRVPHPPAGTDLITLLNQNPDDYALSMGHFFDLTSRSLALFHPALIVSGLALFLGPLAAYALRRQAKPHAANLVLAAGTFTFLLAAHLALQTFAPTLTSAQLAEAIAPQLHPNDIIAIHGEYESGSTLGFYLQRDDLHILEGRSSNLWYGSFFPDSPPIFESPASLATKWSGPQRIFLWQSLTDSPSILPPLPGLVYILVKSGGKEIVSNQPNR